MTAPRWYLIYRRTPLALFLARGAEENIRRSHRLQPNRRRGIHRAVVLLLGRRFSAAVSAAATQYIKDRYAERTEAR